MNGSTTHVWESHENHEEGGIEVVHAKVLQLELKLHTVDIVYIQYILVYMTLYYMYSTSMTTRF